MRLIWIAALLAALFAPGVSEAYVKTVVCDGCGEAEYAKTALRSADGAESILVMDGAHANLRKFRVSQAGDREVNRFRRTVSRVEPTSKEWALFEEMVRLYDLVSHYLDSCGPGGFGDYLVPDFNVDWACEQHDQCYAAGGTSSNRAACDQQLYDNMIALGAGRQLAAAYFLAVRMAGWMYFNFSSVSLADGWDGLSGCAYFEVCDYTGTADLPF